MASRIRAARRDRDWSQTRLIAELQRVALRRGIALPSLETLKSRVSRWENGHATPDEFYRQLLRETLGMDDRELGFEIAVDEPLAAAADELQLRLSLAKAPDGSLLEALRSQTEAIRVQDREFGAGSCSSRCEDTCATSRPIFRTQSSTLAGVPSLGY